VRKTVVDGVPSRLPLDAGNVMGVWNLGLCSSFCMEPPATTPLKAAHSENRRCLTRQEQIVRVGAQWGRVATGVEVSHGTYR